MPPQSQKTKVLHRLRTRPLKRTLLSLRRKQRSVCKAKTRSSEDLFAVFHIYIFLSFLGNFFPAADFWAWGCKTDLAKSYRDDVNKQWICIPGSMWNFGNKRLVCYILNLDLHSNRQVTFISRKWRNEVNYFQNWIIYSILFYSCLKSLHREALFLHLLLMRIHFFSIHY